MKPSSELRKWLSLGPVQLGDQGGWIEIAWRCAAGTVMLIDSSIVQ